MIFIKILSIIALIGSIVWFIITPGFEPALAAVAALSAVISAFVVDERRSRKAQQRQSVSKSSIGIQAGGDVNIGGDKHAK